MTLADELHIFEAAYNASMAEHGGTEPGAARLAGVAALAAALRRTLPGEAGRPTIQLQAREHVGCEWTDIYPAQLEWMSKERYDVRALEARSPSVNGAGGAITDEMLNAHLKATGAWVEPHEAETECGVAIECDLTQEDADQINSDQRDDLRTGYAAMLAAGPQGQSLADSSGPNPGAIGARKGADALTGVAPVASAPTNSADAPAGALLDLHCDEFMPLSLVPLANPNHDPGEHQVMDAETAYIFKIIGSRERAERIVAVLNAAAALSAREG